MKNSQKASLALDFFPLILAIFFILLAPGHSIGGCVDGDCENGHGQYRWPNGDVYNGGWQDGKANGQGRFQEFKGGVYGGEWRNNKMHGRGRKKYADGAVYVGEWRRGDREGQGLIEYANGNIYEGEWRNDRPHGQGRITFKSGNVYEGEFKNGKIEGRGKKVFKNGEVYEGRWENNEQHGQGKRSFKSGDIYAGEFKNGKMNGQGRYEHKGEKTIKVDWQDGKKRENYEYKNGYIYEGELQANYFAGQGKVTHSNGDVYEGEWKDDKHHGAGRYEYADGRVFTGVWEKGRVIKRQWVQKEPTKTVPELIKTAWSDLKNTITATLNKISFSKTSLASFFNSYLRPLGFWGLILVPLLSSLALVLYLGWAVYGLFVRVFQNPAKEHIRAAKKGKIDAEEALNFIADSMYDREDGLKGGIFSIFKNKIRAWQLKSAMGRISNEHAFMDELINSAKRRARRQ